MLKRSLSLLPVVGLLALSMPVNAAPSLGGAQPNFSDLVLVQGPPMKGPPPTGGSFKGAPPKGAPFKGSSPKGGIPKIIVKGPYPRYNGGTRYVWGGLPFIFYDGYYHGDCSWLRRKARETGSAYWWSRYRKCRAD